MKANAGLWIDHREAIVVVLSESGSETKHILSGVESQPRRAADPPNGPFDRGVKADDSQQRDYTGHLARYYDEVAASLRDAGSILIFGPGEAKDELKKRLEKHASETRPIATETAARMTEPQVVAQVRHHFQAGAERSPLAGVSQ